MNNELVKKYVLLYVKRNTILTLALSMFVFLFLFIASLFYKVNPDDILSFFMIFLYPLPLLLFIFLYIIRFTTMIKNFKFRLTMKMFKKSMIRYLYQITGWLMRGAVHSIKAILRNWLIKKSKVNRKSSLRQTMRRNIPFGVDAMRTWMISENGIMQNQTILIRSMIINDPILACIISTLIEWYSSYSYWRQGDLW